MSDFGQSEATGNGSFDRIMGQNRSTTHFAAGNRQISNDGHDCIDLTPSHSIPEALGSTATTSAPITSTGREESAVLSETHSSQQGGTSNQSMIEQNPRSPTLPSSSTTSHSSLESQTSRTDIQLDTSNDQGTIVQKWGLGEWDAEEFDSDNKDMSLIVIMRLAHQLSILQEILETYRSFNVHLGDIASGPRHKGFLAAIFETVDDIERKVQHLRKLRETRQLGTEEPLKIEQAAAAIVHRCKKRGGLVWGLVKEKVDMTNDEERARWLEKKGRILSGVMGWICTYLQGEDEREKGWKEKEVRKRNRTCEENWASYSKMDVQAQKDAGWIL